MIDSEKTEIENGNWIPADMFRKLVLSGKRFGWRKCDECSHFDKFAGGSCRNIGKTTGDSSCDFWTDISL